MANNRVNFLVMLVLALGAVCSAVVHNVGDAAGWTLGFDYNQWASKEKFAVGDTLDFKYDSQFHNVMQVSKNDYEACNANSPIMAYTSGDDSVTLSSTGHSYFICGIPGHCQKGLKVDISVDTSSQTTPTVPPNPTLTPGVPCTFPFCPPVYPPPTPPCTAAYCPPPVAYFPKNAASLIAAPFSLVTVGFLATLFASLAYY